MPELCHADYLPKQGADEPSSKPGKLTIKSIADKITKQPWRLFIVSFLLLFAEVMCIRWFGVEVAIMRVFPNLVLITIFIGSSVGLATYKRPLPRAPVLIFTVFSSLILLSGSRQLKVSELTLQIAPDGSPLGLLASLLLVAFVLVNLTIIFIALGRLLGREFELSPPLQSYSVNLLGSIAGVVTFGIISWLWLPPTTWLVIATAASWYLARKKYILPLATVLIVASAFLHSTATWSPYGKIEVIPSTDLDNTILGKGNFKLLNNNDFFHKGERILPLSGSFIDGYRTCPQWDRVYRNWLEIPFKLADTHDTILVLGAGSGNDVACALQHQVKHIDAVEIDPFIARCGAKLHPNKPYLDPAVDVYVEDARTFLRYSPNKYDIVEFAYLDPGHTLKLSSFLRIDNFVYTTQSIQSALNHLTDRGIVALSFATGGDSPVTRRLYKTITEAYGKPPLCLIQDVTGSCFFFFGPGLRQLSPEILSSANLRIWPGKSEYSDTNAASDDWPFLYLDFTSSAIWLYLFVLATASVAPLTVLVRGLSGNAVFVEMAPMFFLGQAFMLVETKSITQLSLLFGATWIVSSVVILIILLLAFLANWLVDRLRMARTAPCYVGLITTLLLDYFWRTPASSILPPVALSVLSALLSCLPVFFGGMIFSILLKKSPNAVLLLASNVMGVAFGGLLENLCLVVGIRNLSLVALAIYTLSMVSLLPFGLAASRFIKRYLP